MKRIFVLAIVTVTATAALSSKSVVDCETELGAKSSDRQLVAECLAASMDEPLPEISFPTSDWCGYPRSKAMLDPDNKAKSDELKTCLEESAKTQKWQQEQRIAQSKLPPPRIGMTKRQVTDNTNVGRPETINTTETANGTYEQWVYGNGTYLYFRGNRLTSMQFSR